MKSFAIFCACFVASLHTSTAVAQHRWVAPYNVTLMYWNSKNYSHFYSIKYFDFYKGGASLRSALEPLGATANPVFGFPVVRTNVPDYVYNECVAFVRKSTFCPHTSTWRRGRPVIYSNGFSGGVTPGTVVATFVRDSSKPGGYRYEGHTALYLGTTSSGGMLVVDQNWYSDRSIVMHTIPSTFTGSVSDARAYYVVETD